MNESLTSVGHIEAVENIRFAKAMRLLRLITSELDPSGFTLEDVQENFNATTETPDYLGRDIHFGKKLLDYLVERGFLGYDAASKQYHVLRGPDAPAIPDNNA